MSSIDIATAFDLRYVRQGQGPEVLFIAGLGDVAEAWQAQLDGLSDRYTVTAFDNRGAGASPMPAGGVLSVEQMADDAAALLDHLGVQRAHIAGFSGGGMVAQELALRYPDRVRSLVLSGTFANQPEIGKRVLRGLRWLVESAPSDRAFLEYFFTVVYTERFHASGAVDAIIDEVLADPNPQPAENFQAQIDAFCAYDSRDRVHRIGAPTLVLSGERDMVWPPPCGQFLADAIPGAEYVVLAGAGHQPFQEDPADYNARLDAFWSRH